MECMSGQDVILGGSSVHSVCDREIIPLFWVVHWCGNGNFRMRSRRLAGILFGLKQ